MNDIGKATAYVALFSQIGFVLLATVLVGTLGGYWLDLQLGTVPLFVLVGFLVGTSGGSVASWRLIQTFLERIDEDE